MASTALPEKMRKCFAITKIYSSKTFEKRLEKFREIEVQILRINLKKYRQIETNIF